MAIEQRNAILNLLQQNNCSFNHFEHEPVTTSEHAAQIRNVPLKCGAKALVLVDKKNALEHILVVLPGDQKIDFKKLQHNTGKNYTFATSPEAITHCVTGSVPPFGSILGLQTYADSTLDNELFFNIGLLTESIQLTKTNYLLLEQPIVGDFIKNS